MELILHGPKIWLFYKKFTYFGAIFFKHMTFQPISWRVKTSYVSQIYAPKKVIVLLRNT